MDTLLLDRSTWDLVVDANGNIALATAPYALAQDAASAIRTFLGECYYDVSKGVPYFERILGQYPSASVMTAKLEEAAMTVPGVIAAKCYLTGFENRTVTGQVQVTDTDGVISSAAF